MDKSELEIKLTDMVDIKPIGDNQKEVFDAQKGSNQFVFGAGLEQVKLLYYYIMH